MNDEELLRRALDAWNTGVKNWQINNDSIPTAFASLAYVMGDVQSRLVEKTPSESTI